MFVGETPTLLDGLGAVLSAGIPESFQSWHGLVAVYSHWDFKETPRIFGNVTSLLLQPRTNPKQLLGSLGNLQTLNCSLNAGRDKYD